MSLARALFFVTLDLTFKILLLDVVLRFGLKFFELILRAAAVRTGMEFRGRINLSLDFRL